MLYVHLHVCLKQAACELCIQINYLEIPTHLNTYNSLTPTHQYKSHTHTPRPHTPIGHIHVFTTYNAHGLDCLTTKWTLKNILYFSNWNYAWIFNCQFNFITTWLHLLCLAHCEGAVTSSSNLCLTIWTLTSFYSTDPDWSRQKNK